MKPRYDMPCNIAQSLNIIGDRWTLLIVHEILMGRTQFNELKKALNGISSNLLSERLRYLEEEGLIQAELYSKHPPRYRYTLTERGEALEDVFNALIIWGSRHLTPCYKKLVDSDTGDEVAIAYYNTQTGKRVEHMRVIPIEQDTKQSR